ncbi:hypothetical protein, variant [Saprolegnia diclina VS20]|nr:hypothetical protein, variant [Saprolegnia diclina VS20]EQC42229.1 hypothetical protein, variant [Saprolegnia diclina VS20]|eukprot:XP_008604797.1 hypothetical protein, variant [Saprolegnia diclina VS20]
MEAIYRAESIEHLSAIVRKSDDQKVIVTTTHKLSQLVNDKVLLARLLHASTASSSATYKHLAILADEAHRSHTSSTRVSIDTVLQALSTDACKTMYVGFSATPSVQALELFGSGVDPRAPFDTHSLTDAIAHKHIVDVLSHTTFLQSPLVSPSIFAKVKSMMQHFVRLKTKVIFGKCLVVVRSRKDVVAYHTAIQSYMAAQGWPTQVYCTFSAFDGLSEKQLNTTCTLSLADVIVVCDKLDTGYNEPGLIAMYIDRPLSRHAHIVQLLSRLNRARDGKARVHIVDYCNHPLTIWAAFAAYAHAKVLYTRKTDRRHWRRSYEMSRLLLLETLPGYLFQGTVYVGEAAPPTPLQVAASVAILDPDVQSQIRFGLKTYVAASQALSTECPLLPVTWVEALKGELDRQGRDKTDVQEESTVAGSDEAAFDIMYDGPLPFDSETLRGRYGYLSALLSGDTKATCQEIRESPKDALDKRIASLRAALQKGVP